MRRRRTNEKHTFFPWENRGGVLRRLGLRRARPFFIASALLALLVLIGVKERSAAGLRTTRATIVEVRHALDAYLADHEGKCPESFERLADYGHFRGTPRDAWGRPLRLICPSPEGDELYLLSSDGPDGVPGGLDRIE